MSLTNRIATQDKGPDVCFPEADRLIGRQFAVLFAVVALVLGIGYILIIQPFHVPDEAAHFYRTYATSNFTCVGRPVTMVDSAFPYEQALFPPDIENFTFRFLSHAEYEALHPLDSRLLGGSERGIQDDNGNMYSCIPYIPAAADILIGRTIHAPALIVFYGGRLTNLCIYILLTSLALWIMPGFRLILLIVALLPMALQQAASFSADALTNSLSFLWFAYCLHLAFANGRRITANQYGVLCALLAALSLCKFNVWFLLLVLLIPTCRFGSRYRRVVTVAALLILALGVAGSWQIINSHNIDRYKAFRSSVSDVDIQANARELSHGPTVFLASTARTLSTSYIGYLESFIGRLGLLRIVLPPWIVLGCAALLLSAMLFTDHCIRLKLRQRVLLVGIFVASVISIFSLLWLFEITRGQLTQIYAGHTVMMTGFQGRYLIALAPLILAACPHGRMRLSRSVPVVAIAALLVLNAGALVSADQYYYKNAWNYDQTRATAQAHASSRYEGNPVAVPASPANQQRVYVIAGGARYLVADPNWLLLYGFKLPGGLKAIDELTLEQFPYGGPLSVNAAREGDVIPLSVLTAPERYEQKLVALPPDSSDGKVFVVINGQKHWIVQAAWLREHNRSFSDVIFISRQEFRGIKDGVPFG